MASPLGVFARKKRERSPLAMISLYDAPSAQLACDAGADALLVGDSLGNAILGFDSTIPVSSDDVARHLGAVVRGVKASSRPGVPVVADLPLEAMVSHERATEVAVRMLQIGAHAVKFEGDDPDLVRRLTRLGVPVMGHLGFTPQSALGFDSVVQGRTVEVADALLASARRLSEAGVFALVLEAVALEVAARVTGEISAATIGIGAGAQCDGQVLVWNDLIGLSERSFKFARAWSKVREASLEAARGFVADVNERRFPASEHAWAMFPSELETWGRAETHSQPLELTTETSGESAPEVSRTDIPPPLEEQPF